MKLLPIVFFCAIAAALQAVLPLRADTATLTFVVPTDPTLSFSFTYDHSLSTSTAITYSQLTGLTFTAAGVTPITTLPAANASDHFSFDAVTSTFNGGASVIYTEPGVGFGFAILPTAAEVDLPPTFVNSSVIYAGYSITIVPALPAPATYSWNDNSDAWNTGADWTNTTTSTTGTVPGSADTAEIDHGDPTINGGAYTVSNLEMATLSTSATLTIEGGGTLTATGSGSDIGLTSGATINITGAGSELTLSDVSIGENLGSSLIAVSTGGGFHTTGGVYDGIGATASITVDGANSNWTANSDVYIGYDSQGSLAVTNGGAFISSGVVIDAEDGAGSVTIDGTGSKWTASNNVFIGDILAGALTITNGGKFSQTNAGNLTVDHGSSITIGISAINLTVSNGVGVIPGGLVPITTNGGFNFGTHGGGALAINTEYTPTAGDKATLVTAQDGVLGTFSNAAANAFVNAWQITYDATDIYATYAPSTGNVLLETMPNLTPNEFNIAVALDRDIANGQLGNLATALGNVSNATLVGALNQLSSLKFGTFASTTVFNNTDFMVTAFDNYLANHVGADGTFTGSQGGIDSSGLAVNDPNIAAGLQMVHSRMLAWNPAPLSGGLLSDTPSMDIGGVDLKNCSSCAPENLWNAFVSGNVVLAQDFSDPTAGTSHIDATTGSVQVGADYRLSSSFIVGAMFDYSHTDATLDNLGSSATVDTYAPAIYASYANSGWHASALASYGFSNFDQSRNVSIGAFNGTAKSSPDGSQIIGNLDGGYDFHQGPWTFGPTADLQYSHLDVNGFTETGLPGADLTVNDDQSDSLRSRLGGRVAYAIKDDNVVFNPHLSVSWQHEFLDQSRGLTDQFSGTSGGAFVVKTSNPSRDSALTDLGLDAEINKTWDVFADYTVQAGQSNYFGQSVGAGLKIAF